MPELGINIDNAPSYVSVGAIFDFDEDIYRDILQVELISYLRDEQKFAGLDKLKEQLATDKVSALNRLRLVV